MNDEDLKDNKFIEFKKLVYEAKIRQAQEKIIDQDIKHLKIKKIDLD